MNPTAPNRSPINRRDFLATTAAALAVGSLHAQTPSTLWGVPVIDIHFHMRRDTAANVAHLDGCEVQKAILLASAAAGDQVKAVLWRSPGRFVWGASTDITKPEAEQLLTQAVKNGAVGLGELKNHVNADGPELRRMYALAAELNVPILVHFQEFPHFENEGNWSTGFKNFAAMLKAYPKTKFVGHADAFWANVDATYANQEAYPSGPIKRGGVTDKLLTDYPNLYGDLSANSGNNAMSRDPEFTVDFLKRHQDKLMFGSDCSCTDGKGTGISQAGNPAAARLAGKCVARATLTVLKGATTPEIYRKLTWDNTHRIYALKA